MVRRLLGLVALALAGQGDVAAEVSQREGVEAVVRTLAETDAAEVQLALLKGLQAGLAGQRDLPTPQGWESLAERLAASTHDEVAQLAAELAQIFGDQAAVEEALRVVGDRLEPMVQRRRALHGLLVQKREAVAPLLVRLLDEPAMWLEAVRGFAAVEHAEAPLLLLEAYGDRDAEQQRAIVETLATRRAYADALLPALRAGRLPKEHIPPHVARSLQLLLGESFTRVFGDVQPLSVDRQAVMAKYKRLITDDALDEADTGRGRQVFQKTCASCHVLYGEGAKIGPDLTGSNRANLDYLLLNSVDPSYDVPEGYRMVSVITVDGRVINGVVAEEDPQRLILKTVEQPRVVILKRDIESRQVSPKSMMPEGQLDQLKSQEVLDLVKYLQTIEQVELPK